MNTLRSLMVGILTLAALITVPVAALAELSNSTDPDLVGLWHMDGSWEDASGNGNHGIPNNGVMFSTDGKVGTQAGSFNGSNSYVIVPNSASLNITNSLTVELWAKSNINWEAHPDWVYLVNKRNARGFGIFIDSYSPCVVFNFVNTAGVGHYAASSSLLPDTWYHIVGTYDGSSIKIYINGQLQSSAQASGAISTNSLNLEIGRWRDAYREYFNGLIDEVAIYKRPLSAAEIQERYRTVLDKTAPQVTATTPAHLAILRTAPGAVTFTLADAISPLDFGATLNGATLTHASGDKVAGTWSSAGSGTTGTVTFSPASALTEGVYTATIKPTDRSGNGASSSISFTVDTTPPAVGATPAGGIYNSTRMAALAANEPAVIYYTTDGSTPTVNATVYHQPISIPASTTLKYFGRDLAGNDSEIKTEDYVIDSTPPALAISTLSDAAYTNNEILNIAGTVTDSSGVTGVTVNDTAVEINGDGSFSHALLLKNGVNTITIAATDGAGNMAADTRAVTLDQTAPVLAVTTPADNSKTGKVLLDVSGTVDKTSVVTVMIKDHLQSAVMDGGAFSATVILEPGYNTIAITATDLAGNQSSLKRTVIYDDQVPSLAVTLPSQDIRTNQSRLVIKGAVSDAFTAVGVKISKDNEVFTPEVVDGTFEQVMNFAEEKTYGIGVTATNEVGTSTSVQRNVIYDVTPPVLSIDPVSSPTSRPSLSVTGTREAGATVTVTSATATVGEVSYPSETTWLVDISALREGENVITAASADAAGNAVAATATIVLATRPPEITITATPDVIWPPDHQMVPVTIAGGVEAYGSDIESVSISVRDEYGKFKYDNLTFGSTVMLEAWRKGNDKDGRKYTITVVVTGQGGIRTAKTATVTVPHDQGKLKDLQQAPAKRKKRTLF